MRGLVFVLLFLFVLVFIFTMLVALATKPHRLPSFVAFLVVTVVVIAVLWVRERRKRP